MNSSLPFTVVGKKVNDAAREVTDFLNDAVGTNKILIILTLELLPKQTMLRAGRADGGYIAISYLYIKNNSCW